MAEEPNQIERHIQATRVDLGNNLHELQHRVKRATDWHTYIDRYPATMVALAFAGGVLAGALPYRSRGSGAGGESYGFHESRSARDERRGTDLQKDKAADTLDTIKGAIVGLATSQLKKLLSDTVPGFREHFEATERQKSGAPAHPAPATVSTGI